MKWIRERNSEFNTVLLLLIINSLHPRSQFWEMAAWTMLAFFIIQSCLDLMVAAGKWAGRSLAREAETKKGSTS